MMRVEKGHIELLRQLAIHQLQALEAVSLNNLSKLEVDLHRR